MFLRSSAGDGSFRRSPHVELGVGMYSSTTANSILYQKQHVQHPTQRSTHHNHPPCTAAQQYAQQAAVREYVQRLLPHRIGFSMFSRSPAISGTRGFFRCSPLVEFGVGARSFADKTLCRRVGRAWRGRAAAGGRVAPGQPFQNGAF